MEKIKNTVVKTETAIISSNGFNNGYRFQQNDFIICTDNEEILEAYNKMINNKNSDFFCEDENVKYLLPAMIE